MLWDGESTGHHISKLQGQVSAAGLPLRLVAQVSAADTCPEGVTIACQGSPGCSAVWGPSLVGGWQGGCEKGRMMWTKLIGDALQRPEACMQPIEPGGIEAEQGPITPSS